jgi:hypothetical protein
VFVVQEEKGVDIIYHTNLETEIKNWRINLRESEYLTTPFDERPPCSMLGKELDPDFVNFSSKCKSNLIDYIKCCSESNAITQQKCLEPIFITQEDRQQFNNIMSKTKDEIVKRIKSEIQELKELDYDIGN